MPSILYGNAKVDYIARKNFRLGEKQFKTGDDAPEMNDHPKLETFVRAGYVIPVVEDKDDLPFQFRRTVMTRDMALYKLGKGPKPTTDQTGNALRGEDSAPNGAEDGTDDSGEFDPGEHKMDEVLDYVENNPDEITSVYELEEQGKNRPTLLSKLDDILNETTEENNDD